MTLLHFCFVIFFYFKILFGNSTADSLNLRKKDNLNTLSDFFFTRFILDKESFKKELNACWEDFLIFIFLDDDDWDDCDFLFSCITLLYCEICPYVHQKCFKNNCLHFQLVSIFQGNCTGREVDAIFISKNGNWEKDFRLDSPIAHRQ